MDLQKEVYEAPECECLEMVNEGVLCASAPIDASMQSSINSWDDGFVQESSVDW